MPENPFGIQEADFLKLARGKADPELIDRLRIEFEQDDETLNFIDSMAPGVVYMETHQDLLKRRSRRGHSGLKQALLEKLNDLT